MARQQPIELFMPPNMLKAKVGGGGFDAAALTRAEAAMDQLKGEFTAWAGDDVKALATALKTFNASGDDAARAALTRAAHDIRGQAATFGYPMMARMAVSLVRLLAEARVLPAGLAAGLAQAHVAAIQVILREKITDAANPTALALCTELEKRVGEALT